jgi:hypothetical protein
MISINLAFDEELAKELVSYLNNLGIDCMHEKSLVEVNQDSLDEKVLSAFLEKINRVDYVIKKINKKSYLISKEASVQDFGLGTCEICGLVDFEEKLFSHRWTHGI